MTYTHARPTRPSGARATALLLAGSALTAATMIGAGGSAAAATRPSVVAFGDSVPSGAVCQCTNFVTAYARQLPGSPSVANYAQGGTSSADVVQRLSERAVAARVRTATTVLIMTGANDFYDPFLRVSDGASAHRIYSRVEKRVRRNVEAEVRRVHRLNPSARVVVLDYWAALEDGAAAQRDYNASERRAAAQATTYLNRALAAAARHASATFVSTLRAIKGPSGTADPTPLLASDGDHPNAAGHRAIADAIAAVLPRG